MPERQHSPLPPPDDYNPYSLSSSPPPPSLAVAGGGGGFEGGGWGASRPFGMPGGYDGGSRAYGGGNYDAGILYTGTDTDTGGMSNAEMEV